MRQLNLERLTAKKLELTTIQLHFSILKTPWVMYSWLSDPRIPINTVFNTSCHLILILIYSVVCGDNLPLGVSFVIGSLREILSIPVTGVTVSHKKLSYIRFFFYYSWTFDLSSSRKHSFQLKHIRKQAKECGL